MQNVTEVKESWFHRTMALLFGRKVWFRILGARCLFSYWHGVWYMLYSSGAPNTRLQADEMPQSVSDK